MAADIKTFWGALLSVLLKCIAALGFATRDRAAVRGQAVAADITGAATVESTARVAVGARAEAAASIPAPTVPAPVGPSVPPSRRGAGARIPAPRAAESRLVRRNRGRTLPPTMKQRIGAEAHGTSPSARSLRTADAIDEFGDLGALATAAGAPAAAGTTNDSTASTRASGPTASSGSTGSADGAAQQGRENAPSRSGAAKPTRALFTRAA